MRKNVFDEGFSDSFIQYIIELQALDTRSTKQPLYREKLDFVFGVMSDRFLSRLRENVGELDTSALTLDRALSYYVQGGEGDELLDYIASRIHAMCELMHISPEAYGTSIYCTAVLIARGLRAEAYAMFNVAMRPLVAAYRRREAAGKKSGRPAHRHKNEAIDIAAEFRQEVPEASLYRVVQVVAGELARQYTDPPSARSIETWLKQRGYKTNRRNSPSTQKFSSKK
ncbi:hypothetical protein [Salmonella enterica]|nr:hypothetical protein [Salmonella enterica]EBQ9804789.1 hypothetical protein [Salmonella enterica subsp. enterica serovar Rissen]EBW9751447.1 hypothetical protein [Salmonella enterica subsp. enterica serovar Kingston]ECI6683318.1 hypothetical protein [Salmonella enterica subsp. enterica]EDM9771433.1 hypothetical protein [Salmonella enterica subsp. enterica serovar Corvallis]EBC7954397.1 hypothetical protein [Salmonella enterica]